MMDPESVEQPWSREIFEQKLREQGHRYHLYHPFQVMMNAGQLNQKQIRGWVANRFYYQINIPIKDAAILSNCPDRDVRRHWLQRMIDQDGREGEEGGIEAWIRLGEAVGLPCEVLLSQTMVLPGVRFAVDAYVNFARTRPWQEAVCASLTELFAPEIHRQRLSNWPQHYDWIKPAGLEYFRTRLEQARRDVDHGLAITLDYFKTRAQQEQAVRILNFKLDILWSMLDAMQLAYMEEDNGRRGDQ